MLKELVQELSQNLTNIETLTKENGELKTEKEIINSQLLAVNESLRVALENKTTLETEVNTLNTTIENLNRTITEKDNRITELKSQVVDPVDLEELKTILVE